MSLAEPRERAVKRTVALAGATGLVGRSILEGLLADTSVQSVHVLARRKLQVAHARLTCHIVEFAALSPLPALDEVYLALGTTIKVAGSQAAFRSVDFDANLAVARATLAAGARRWRLARAMGSEREVPEVRQPRRRRTGGSACAVSNSRASSLRDRLCSLGDRAALGQPERSLEKVSAVFSKMLGLLIPPNYRAVAAADVARTLLAQTPFRRRPGRGAFRRDATALEKRENKNEQSHFQENLDAA